MVAAGRARATRAHLIDDRFAVPLVRAVGVDFFTRWATGELAAGDVDVPARRGNAQIQDRLLDITALSLDGSRLASEVAVMPASADGDQTLDR